MRIPLVVVLAGLGGLACTPEVATDPLPEVMEFDPAVGRVSEPSFLAIDPGTGKVNLAAGGIVVPPDCAAVASEQRAQCELNQYVQSLDGFPTSLGARTPVSSAALDLTSVVPGQTLAVVETRGQRAMTDVVAAFDATGRYLQVAPTTAWPSDTFVWIGVRGYEKGIRVAGKPVAASVTYNLLKREQPLTCVPVAEQWKPIAPAAIDARCPFLQLLAAQLPDPLARAALVQLEEIRLRIRDGGGWTAVERLGGIAKDDLAILWGFPTHSGPVIDLDPTRQLGPRVTPAGDEIQLPVNGTIDPATVKAFRLAREPGSVYLMDLMALGQDRIGQGFPAITASYAGGMISIKTATPLAKGGLYGVLVSREVKSLGGKAMVPPPPSVLLTARGPVANTGGKSLVANVSDADALQIEFVRAQLEKLFDDANFQALTGIRRETIGFFSVVVPQ